MDKPCKRKIWKTTLNLQMSFRHSTTKYMEISPRDHQLREIFMLRKTNEGVAMKYPRIHGKKWYLLTDIFVNYHPKIHLNFVQVRETFILLSQKIEQFLERYHSISLKKHQHMFRSSGSCVGKVFRIFVICVCISNEPVCIHQPLG